MRVRGISGAKIREARKTAGLTQAQLGEKMNVSGSMIGQYENGTRNASITTAKQIADILGIDWESLVENRKLDDYIRSHYQLVLEQEDERSRDLEGQILYNFLKLNIDGRLKAIERVEELTEIPRYQK